MKRIINFAVCMAVGLTVIVFSTPKVYADMTWTCTKYKYTRGMWYTNSGSEATQNVGSPAGALINGQDGDYAWNTSYCYTATISGSVSASITEAEKQDIANRVINSTRLQNIESYALDAKNTLRSGADNNGKSLAAAYDKANSAASNASTAATNASNAKTAADNAKASADRSGVIRVVKGVPFTEAVYGQLVSSTQTVSGVTAAPGTGYTTLTGTLNTIGIQKITIGSTDLLFKVVDAPTTSYSAAVNFSN